MSTHTLNTYNDFLAHWSENDKKAEKYIKDIKPFVIDMFYLEIHNYSNGELPKEITASAKYPTTNDGTWIYPKHTPAIRTMCKEVEEFIVSKGFPYKLNVSKSGVENVGVWPIRCQFELKK